MKNRVSKPRLLLLLAAGAALAAACSPAPETGRAEPPSPEPTLPVTVQRPPGQQQEAAAEGPLLVFLGDSLTAGLGVGEAEAFPEGVGGLLEAEGIDVRVVNAGVRGATTAGGRARLDWLLRQQPDVLVVGLGANDGLRGLALEETEANLRQIVETAREAGARVLLLGMMLPPNYGSDYTQGFQAIYPKLAAELEVPLVPFLLTGVAGVPELNQADGIHPTVEGHRLMAANVLPFLRPLVESQPALLTDRSGVVAGDR